MWETAFAKINEKVLLCLGTQVVQNTYCIYAISKEYLYFFKKRVDAEAWPRLDHKRSLRSQNFRVVTNY